MLECPAHLKIRMAAQSSMRVGTKGVRDGSTPRRLVQIYNIEKGENKMKIRLLSAFLLIVLLATVSTAAAADNRNFRAHLNGAGAGVETLAQGQAIFQFSADGSALHYKLIVANIENLWMAHIHLAGEPGGNGPPVVWLYPAAPPPPSQSLPDPDGVLATGTVTAANLVGPLAGMSLADLKMNMEMGLTYVNVHTNDFEGSPNSGPGDFLGGEIRGTIH